MQFFSIDLFNNPLINNIFTEINLHGSFIAKGIVIVLSLFLVMVLLMHTRRVIKRHTVAKLRAETTIETIPTREKTTTEAATGKPSMIQNANVPKIDLIEFQLKLEIIEESVSVYSKIAIFGAVTKDIFTQGGSVLLLYGICAGNVVVYPKGRAVIYGTVIGSVINNGGEVYIFGKIIGGLVRNAGETHTYSVAQIMNDDHSQPVGWAEARSPTFTA